MKNTSEIKITKWLMKKNKTDITKWPINNINIWKMTVSNIKKNNPDTKKNTKRLMKSKIIGHYTSSPPFAGPLDGHGSSNAPRLRHHQELRRGRREASLLRRNGRQQTLRGRRWGRSEWDNRLEFFRIFGGNFRIILELVIYLDSSQPSGLC